jgi:(1->4)-alpha-D-glucan 1-alpha-D-glucosylmutase
VDVVIEGINASPQKLKRFLDRQHYRLAFWRNSNRDLNYRRFFDIHQLAGICVEKEDVFAATHERVIRWLQEGRLAGLRIDHPDGLRDPTHYLQRLHEAAPESWIAVEKILEPGETLNPEWPVSGTTGYDFLNILGGLFIDPLGEKALTELYRDLTAESTDYHEVVRRKKIQILETILISEMSRLTDLLVEICRNRRAPNVLRGVLHGALAELIACFPVYRTYIRPESGKVESRDRTVIASALNAAVRRRPAVDTDLWRFLEDILLLRLKGEAETDFVLRFQQLTGPAMAKGLEDTTFYCFNRLVALNEVGGNPGQFGTPPEAFHAFCRHIQTQWPQSLTATATHDTKRGEDTRLRIALLSEVPQRWAQAVRRWFRMNAPFRRHGLPDANSEYFLYQTLVGTWPIAPGRLLPYMLKAAKESKVHTSWTDPNPAFEQSLQAFVEGVLGHAEFIADLAAFLEPLMRPAMMTSLAQTLIKCTAPGIPDVYQGTELWDLSLVDPDNRRAVDYSRRRRMLADLNLLSVEEILDRHPEGLPKLFVLQRALLVRRQHPDVFGPQGGYDPLTAEGDRAHHFVGFVRGGRVLTLAPRLAVGLGAGWGDTRIHLDSGTWTDIFTGERWNGGPYRLERLLARFPVGLLVREGKSS